MKKFLKFIFGVVGSVYLLFAIFVTVCLLCYNQHKVTEFGDKTFIIIDDKSDEYTSGDLVIFTRNANDEITTGSKIFFYEVNHGKSQVLSSVVTKSEKISDEETTFTIGGNHAISSESVIGKTETASIVPKVGKILSIFESQYGFLILIILPAMLLFFYAIYSVIRELKQPKEEAEPERIDAATNAQNMVANNPQMQVIQPETAAQVEQPAQPVPQVDQSAMQQPMQTQMQPVQQSVEQTTVTPAEPLVQAQQADANMQSAPNPAPATEIMQQAPAGEEIELPLPSQTPNDSINNGAV